jgi:crotonobetaine/carnitine-CoA ligase
VASSRSISPRPAIASASRLIAAPDTDVAGLLFARAAEHPRRIWIEWEPFAADGRTWTYGELAADVRRFAAGLAGHGVRRGDRLLIHLDNCPEFIVAWFACAVIGAVAVTTNTKSALAELSYYAADAEVVAAITQPRFAELVAAAIGSGRRIICTSTDQGVPPDSGSRAADCIAFESLLADPSGVPGSCGPHDPMSIQYTSGTTSRPKGVLWTHANAVWGGQVSARHEGLRADDCHLVYMPLFHTNALVYSTLATLAAGARMVLIPKWSTSRFWDISVRKRCTWLCLMGLSTRSILAMDPPAEHYYRMFGTGRADQPWQDRLHVKALGWWGMTETITHGVIGDTDRPNRPMSMGRPAPEFEIAVVRDDFVTPTADDEAGHLLIRGTRGVSMFAEYINRPADTAASFDEWGWFRTGDLASWHGDGHLSFAGRDKDMLKVGAENVASLEIETVMMSVGGVREAAVVGRADDKLDEVPVAFVVGDQDDAGLPGRVLAACARDLADFKVPRHIYVVSALPRSTIDKVSKADLQRVVRGDTSLAAAEEEWLIAGWADPSGDADSRSPS